MHSSLSCFRPADDVAEATLLKVRELIKVEGLRTFVLTYSSYYNSLGTQRLSEMFELNPSKVRTTFSHLKCCVKEHGMTVRLSMSFLVNRFARSGFQMGICCCAGPLCDQQNDHQRGTQSKLGSTDGLRDDSQNGTVEITESRASNGSEESGID